MEPAKQGLEVFFVVGAQKAGTSALYDAFTQCKDFTIPKKKEFHLLVDQKPVSKADYLSELGVFSGLTGDFSPSYLYSPFAAQNILNYFPESKIIMVLRSPSERAYSNMVHCVRLGKEKRLDLQALISDESERVSKKSSLYHYLSKGFYFEQVKRYVDTFPKDRILILLHEDLVKRPNETLAEAFHFVGLTQDNKAAIKNVNTGHVGRFGLSSQVVRFYNKLHLSKLLPEIVKTLGKRAFMQKADKPDKNWFIELNLTLYLDNIKKLEKLINKDLSSWYTHK